MSAATGPQPQKFYSRKQGEAEKPPYVVALVGISTPGYTCLANKYLREALRNDTRLPAMAIANLEFDDAMSPFWILYSILELDYTPDLLGFSVYCWNAGIVYEVLKLLERLRPEQRIVLGGPEVGPIADELYERFPQVTYIARGEGEKVICEVVRSLTRGGDPRSIPEPELQENLDAIPSPYNDANPPATDGSAYIETSRGCPHACAYCYEGKGISRVRSFSWERIKADIDRVATTPGMQSFSFLDSVFNLTDDRLKRISDIMAPYAQQGIRLHTIEVDIERIDDEAAALLKRAGVMSVETGPQTVGATALSNCNRALDKEKYIEGVAACRRAGIRVEADLIIGLPGDTVEEVLESMRFALHANPGVIQVSTLHVLPGTFLWDRAEEFGLIYNEDPPHEIIETNDISYVDLRNLEVFGNALSSLYRAGI